MIKSQTNKHQMTKHINKLSYSNSNTPYISDMRHYIGYKSLYTKDLYSSLMSEFNINVCIQNKQKKIQNPTTIRLSKKTVLRLRKLVWSGVTLDETLCRILDLLDREIYLKNKIQNWQVQEDIGYPDLEKEVLKG